MIRILCVFATLNRGGAENMCMNLYRAIDRESIQFDFVKHTSASCDFDEEIQAFGGKIYIAPKYSPLAHRSYNKWWCDFLTNHPEYHIIHGHYFTISHIYFKIAHRFGRTTVGHSHSERANLTTWKYWIKQQSVRWIEKESDYCLACSRAAGEYLFPHKKYIVLNNAIDTNKFAYNPETSKEVKRELGISDTQKVVGVCGSFTPPKNPFGIIEIFKEIHKCDANVLLLWVGDGQLREQVMQKIKENEIEQSVILTGVRADVYRMMQAMDVFILPSLWEGMAVVSIEAQAAGLPCFFSDTVTKDCAITDLVHYLPLNNPDLWAKDILTCDLNRKDTSEQIIKAGFDITSTARWLEMFYYHIESSKSNLGN